MNYLNHFEMVSDISIGWHGFSKTNANEVTSYFQIVDFLIADKGVRRNSSESSLELADNLYHETEANPRFCF